MPDDRPVMWSELRRIVDMMSAVQPVQPQAVPIVAEESWKPSSDDNWLLVVCQRCAQHDDVPHARNFTPPPCSAECAPGARMFPRDVLPYVKTTAPIDPEALANAIWQAIAAWGKANYRDDDRTQRDVIRDAIKNYLKERQA